MKTKLYHVLTLLIGLGLMLSTLVDRQAVASRFEETPRIQVGHLGSYRGQNVTLLYVLASKPILAFDPNQVFVSKVKAIASQRIENDEQVFESSHIEIENLRGSYNMVLILVSPQENPIWQNVDGSIPSGQSSGEITDGRQITKVNVITKSEVETELQKNNLQVFRWNLK